MAFELVYWVLVLQCIRDWPDDGRPYVALGTLLRKSGMVQEARKVFEDGCQAVRGENPYIWQVGLLFASLSVSVFCELEFREASWG